MSMESARRFCERVQQDRQFADSLKAANTEMEIAELVLGAGFDFTMDELDQVLKASLSTPSMERELSETEMQAVAGGMIGGIGFSPQSLGAIVDQIGTQGLNVRTYK
jgi:predicted ribosomally synthesized peptide with nif11-like leader